MIVGVGAVVQRPADRAETAAALADLGNRLLSLPTALIRDFSKNEDEVKKAVKVEATLP